MSLQHGNARDIREWGSLSAALRAEVKFARIADVIPQMVWSARQDGYKDYCNRRWHDFTGMSYEADVTGSWHDLVYPEDWDRVLARWHHSLATGEDYESEYRLKHRSGEYRWILAKASPIRDEQGDVERWFGTYTDIHEAKKTKAALADSEERYRALIGAGASIVWRATPDGRIVEGWGWDALRGRRPAEYLGYSWLEAVHPEDRERLVDAWRSFREAGQAGEAEYRVLCRDEEYRWVHSRAVPLRAADGSVREWVGTISDIHEQKQAEEALRNSEERLRLALKSARMFAWEQELTSDYVARSENARILLGIGSSPIAEFMERVPAEDHARRNQFFEQILSRGTATMEFRYTLESGKTLWLASRGEKAGPNRVLGVTFDITDRKEAEDEVWQVANHDPLTGLPNRVLFQQRLERALAEAEVKGTSVNLLLIDLDNFKDVNDTLGHDAGDALLTEMAGRLSPMVRDCDTVARLGGDEFAVLIVEPSGSGNAAGLANHIIKRLRQPFPCSGRTLIGTASIGIASFPEHDSEPSELMKDADIALYRAKAEGRDRAVVYSPAMRIVAEQRITLARQVRDAIARNQIIPVYQPKVCLSTGRIVGLEALARWQHPTEGLLTPSKFAIAFEDPELARILSKRLIGRVASEMRKWLDAGLDFGRVAVNFSSAEFSQPDLADEILRILDLVKVPAKHFEVEVTEKVFLDERSGLVAAALEKFRRRGVQIALDDFGTGYASLTHLKQFPVDHIKIDQSFVRDLAWDKDNEAIVTAVVALGRSLALEVTAEGVETEVQAQRLRAMGCHNAQGYLYARPMPGIQVPELF